MLKTKRKINSISKVQHSSTSTKVKFVNHRVSSFFFQDRRKRKKRATNYNSYDAMSISCGAGSINTNMNFGKIDAKR